jgi:putative transposase
LQQFREALPSEHHFRWVIHDRSGCFSPDLDVALSFLGVQALKTPVGAPKANAYCERLIGTIRRECLDFLIPMNERHLRSVLKEWMTHYNHGRPHLSLGPGIPDPLPGLSLHTTGHRLPHGHRVRKKPILGGLHHEYRLEKIAA